MKVGVNYNKVYKKNILKKITYLIFCKAVLPSALVEFFVFVLVVNNVCVMFVYT